MYKTMKGLKTGDSFDMLMNSLIFLLFLYYIVFFTF